MFTKNDIEKYFVAEKQQSFLFIIMGVASVIIALVFFVCKQEAFYAGAAVPPAFIGLLMLVVGVIVYRRSDEDRKQIVYAYDLNPSMIKEIEIPRMKKVMKNFVHYRNVEIFLFILGWTFFIYLFKADSFIFLKGLGLSLAIMAAITLVADYFAALRGKKYLAGLTAFVG
ncbi:MAG: hypothetical protein RIR12_505 [Bacteroidota bacterium]|jgi:hypothetical protein